MDSHLSFVSTAAAILAVYLLSRIFTASQPRLPPGPKGYPIVGNMFDMPASYSWKHFAKHKELYGPISSLSILGQTFIIINDYDIAVQLLEKRSLNYSDRVPSTFGRMYAVPHLGWNFRDHDLLPYGHAVNVHRKTVHRFTGRKEVVSHLNPIVELEARRFVLRTMNQPAMLQENIRHLTGAIILKITYGYSVDTTRPDPLVALADEAMRYIGYVVTPGKWLVDVFPLVQYFPNWMPGSHSKRMAAIYKTSFDKFREWPHAFVKKQMAEGKAPFSFDSAAMEEKPSKEEELLIKWSALALYGGATDTTVSAIYSFFLAMQLFPEVQRKAQAEIDCIIGPDRMPVLADLPSLPYIEAVVKEILRWNVVVPAGVPHVSREIDFYEGYCIPKGSAVVYNAWRISRDNSIYRDAETFNPERFLASETHDPELNPRNFVFGFGRRVCPGQELAISSIFLAITMILATLNIQKVRGEDDRDITPIYDVTGQFVSHPKPFPCSITPRSARARDLVLTVEDEPFNPEGDADILRNIPTDGSAY